MVEPTYETLAQTSEDDACAARETCSAKPTQRRLLIPLVIVLLAIAFGVAAGVYAILSSTLQRDGQRSLQTAVYDLNRLLEDRTHLLTALQDAYLDEPELTEAMARQDRQRLLDLSASRFEQDKKQHGITHLYFHDADGVNVLRVHEPSRFGDPIQRHTMLQARHTDRPASGLELGPLGTFTLRVVRPVYGQASEPIGYLELGQEIEGILSQISQERGLELAITIHKQSLDRASWERGRGLWGQEARWDHFQDDVLIYSSLDALSKWGDLLEREYLTPADTGDSADTPGVNHHHLREAVLARAGDRWWYSSTQPMRDAAGIVVGDLFVFDDVTAVIAELQRVIFWWVALGITVLTLLIGFLYKALRNVDRTIVMREDELRGNTAELTESLRREERTRSELESAIEELYVAERTDKLTGLPNRTMFLEVLGRLMERARVDGSRFAVLYLDFDRFKIVNDSLGHSVGDELLCDIARTIRRNLCENDVLARFGGDEFGVLLTDLASWPEAELMALSLLEILEAPHRLHDHLIVTTASIGLVTNQHGHADPETMIRDADVAMYQAKSNGKAQVTVFDRAMHESAMERMRVEEDLRAAMSAKDQFHLMYQPIIDLNSGHLTGFEALLRWNRPGHDFISPGVFIPIAEDIGLIGQIGSWVMDAAAEQVARWNRVSKYSDRLSVNVNVSKLQLLSPAFINEVLACRDKYGLRPGDLHLEITESVIADSHSDVTSVLHELRRHKFPVVMDDFGTGVSSLSALHEYPIDILKIDQAFIRTLNRNRSLLAVVMSITNMAENLGIRTVAEGIETEYVVGALQSINCNMGQGYLFAKPLSPTDAETYIRLHGSRRDEAAA